MKQAEKEEKAKAKALKQAEKEEKAKAKALKQAEKEEKSEAKLVKEAKKEETPLAETNAPNTTTPISEEKHEELSDDEEDEEDHFLHKFTLDQKNYGVDCDNDVFEIQSNGDTIFVGVWDPESKKAVFEA